MRTEWSRRAVAVATSGRVARSLVAAGASSAQLTAVGFGQDRPVAPNAHPDGSDNPDGRQENRRVEIVLRES